MYTIYVKDLRSSNSGPQGALASHSNKQGEKKVLFTGQIRPWKIEFFPRSFIQTLNM